MTTLEQVAVEAPECLAAAPAVRRRSLHALAVAARPQQWVKNGLVLAAPAAAGVLGRPGVLDDVLAAFVAFCLAASGTYFLNDVLDAAHDRRHPEKRSRPVAAGDLSRRAALAASGAATAAALAIAVTVGATFTLAIAGYVLLTVAYTLWLKHMRLLDLAAIAACFVVRAVGGGAAAHVGISRWFLAVVTLAALFVVTGKRFAEQRRLGAEARAMLAGYSPALLRAVWRGAAAGTAVAYLGWALTHPLWRAGIPWSIASAVPFALCVGRYGMLLDAGLGDDPETVLYSDRGMQALALAWGATFAIGIRLST